MATTPSFASTNIKTNTFLDLGGGFPSYVGQWADQPTVSLPNIITAGANGTRITEINVKATANLGNLTYKIYLFDGSTYYLFDEQFFRGSTGSTTVTAEFTFLYDYLYLPSGWSLRLGMSGDFIGQGNGPTTVLTSLDI